MFVQMINTRKLNQSLCIMFCILTFPAQLKFRDLPFLWTTHLFGSFSGSNSRSIYCVHVFYFIMYMAYILSNLLILVTQKASISYDRKFKHGLNFIHTLYCTRHTAVRLLQQFWRKKWSCWCWKVKSHSSEVRLVGGERWRFIDCTGSHRRLRRDLSFARKEKKKSDSLQVKQTFSSEGPVDATV